MQIVLYYWKNKYSTKSEKGMFLKLNDELSTSYNS